MSPGWSGDMGSPVKTFREGDHTRDLYHWLFDKNSNMLRQIIPAIDKFFERIARQEGEKIEGGGRTRVHGQCKVQG